MMEKTHIRAKTPFFHQKAEQRVRTRADSITMVATAYKLGCTTVELRSNRVCKPFCSNIVIFGKLRGK